MSTLKFAVRAAGALALVFAASAAVATEDGVELDGAYRLAATSSDGVLLCVDAPEAAAGCECTVMQGAVEVASVDLAAGDNVIAVPGNGLGLSVGGDDVLGVVVAPCYPFVPGLN